MRGEDDRAAATRSGVVADDVGVRAKGCGDMKAPLGNLYSPRGATSIYRFDFSGAGGGRNVLRLYCGAGWGTGSPPDGSGG
ncbi:MAG: hypothetical protein J6A20_00630 [Muribaculaceae bacterium]|nr:hypothetical protein [Muribaculaceae bacterium]